jgi:hypothetical protein
MSPVRAALAAAALVAFAGASSLSAQAAPRTPPRMLHPAAGKQDCLSCHAQGANAHITSVPASHHFANGACGMCHKPSAEAPPPIKHAVDAAHEQCRTCHVQAAEGAAPAAGAAPAPPASHEKFDASTCRLCHEPAAAPSDSGQSGG